MDLNVKLPVEEVAKQLLAEIKEGFVTHETAFTKLMEEVTITERLRGACLVNLKEATASSDKALAAWRPEVDASITSVKLEFSKLNTFFAREAKAPTGTQQGLLATVSAHVTTSAATDGPNGHRVAPYQRDCEFGRVHPNS
jgi:hypothetical protein